MTILVITTGGTIGARSIFNKERALFKNRNLVAEYLQQHYSKQKIRCLAVCNIDSTRIQTRHIQKIAKVINQTNYRKYIVTHGTDTAIVTAQKLPTLIQNLQKSILITGAFLPLTDPQSDGHRNLQDCLFKFKSSGIKLVFEGRLLDPFHTQKVLHRSKVSDSRRRFIRTPYPPKSDTFYRKYGTNLARRLAKTM